MNTEEAMAELILKRKRQFFAPANCCYQVYLNEVKKTTLSNGSSDRFKLDAGAYKLKIKNNYFTSRTIDLVLSADEKVVIETFSMPLLGWLYFLSPVVLIIFSALKLFHVLVPGILFSLGLIPLFLFITLAVLLGIIRKAILVKILK